MYKLRLLTAAAEESNTHDRVVMEEDDVAPDVEESTGPLTKPRIVHERQADGTQVVRCQVTGKRGFKRG